MRPHLARLVAGWILATALGSIAAQYHHPVYLVGGQIVQPNTVQHTGLNQLDATGTPSMTKLVEPGFYSEGWTMDVDNRNVVFAVRYNPSTPVPGVHAGLFRYDPTHKVVLTIQACRNATLQGEWSFFDVVVDSSGDYLTNVEVYHVQNRRTDAYVWRIDRTGGVTTVASTLQMGRVGDWDQQIARDIDTGKLLLSDGRSESTSTSVHYPILEIDPDGGAIGVWSTGGAGGWWGDYSLPQNHRTGFVEGARDAYVYQIRPGTTSRTTLTYLSGRPFGILGGGDYDLQTAAQPRQVFVSHSDNPTAAPTVLYLLDATTWTVTWTGAASLRCINRDFAFYRGRHTQTVQTGARLWEVRLSAPMFPGKPYAVVAGLSGVRPGITLPDGRRLNLNLDPIVYLTLTGQLPGIWHGGPGQLDALGEARGALDLSAVGPALGVPLWIAWAVLDAQAPCGLAYLPDTYVIRI